MKLRPALKTDLLKRRIERYRSIGLKKIIGAIGIGLIISVIVAELTLQFAALINRSINYVIKNTQDTRKHVTIACAGDSFTYGLYLPLEQSYPAQLEQILRENQPDIPWRIIKISRPGWNSTQVVNALEKVLNKQVVNTVLLMMGLNNFWNFREMNPPANQADANDKNFLFSVDQKLSFSRLYLLLKLSGQSLYKEYFDFLNRKGNTINEIEDEITADLELSGISEVEARQIELRDNLQLYDSDAPVWLAEQAIQRRWRNLGLFAVLRNARSTNYSKEFLADFLSQPEDCLLVAVRAECYRRQARLQDAAEELDKCPEDNWQKRWVLAEIACDQNNILAALENFSMLQALGCNSRNRFAWMVTNLIKANRMTEATATLLQAVELYGNELWIQSFIPQIFEQADTVDANLLRLLHLNSPFSRSLFRNQPTTSNGQDWINWKNQTITDILIQDLERVVEMCGERKIRLVILGYPAGEFPTETLSNFTAERNLFFIPLSELLRSKYYLSSEQGQSSYQNLFLKDGHCSSQGNRAIAKIVTNEVFLKAERTSRADR